MMMMADRTRKSISVALFSNSTSVRPKIRILLCICSSLSMAIVLCTYSHIFKSEVGLNDEHFVLPMEMEMEMEMEQRKERGVIEMDGGGRKLHIEEEEASTQRTSTHPHPHTHSAKGSHHLRPHKSMRTRRPPVVSSSLKRTYDTCRNQLTSTVTLSISEFCLANATSDFDNLSAQFDLIEQSLSPFSSMFDEAKNKNNYTAVIVPNVLCHQEERVHPSDITLTTQMSTNKVRRLVALAARWNGPISVAVKVISIQDFREFQSLLHAHQEHLKKVAFHLYFESRHRDYPNNILRNLALDRVQSDYFALFDVDLLPSPMNTHQHLRSTFDDNPQLEDRLKDKTVFILPAWEIEEEISNEDITIQHPLYPETKEMVLKMNGEKMSDRKLRIFRHVFEPGHRSTDYPKWTSNNTDISYPIEAEEYGYEPYIIGAMKDAPRFFRDFRGYGFNKLSYYVELHYAKYSMEVLRDFFIFHVNHPSTYGEERTKSRMVNMVCVKTFMEYLARDYGAGYLDDEEEVAGLETWRRRMAQGQGTGDYYEEAEEDEEEEEEESEDEDE